MVTRNGKIKRTRLDSYRNVKKSGLIAIGLDDGDEIRGALMSTGADELLVATKGGRIIRFAEETLRAMSRSAHGVRAIKLREGDEVVSMEAARDDATVLTVSDKGYGRRVPLSEYRRQNRGGYGILNYKTGEAKGEVCGIKVVDLEDDVILISNDGIVIRVRAQDISMMGRYSSGVTIMRTKDTPERRVAAFTTAAHDEEAEITEVEQLSDDELRAIADAEAAEEAAEEDPDEAPDDEEGVDGEE